MANKVGRPKTKTQPDGRINIFVPRSLKVWLRTAAASEDRALTNLANEIITAYVQCPEVRAIVHSLRAKENNFTNEA